MFLIKFRSIKYGVKLVKALKVMKIVSCNCRIINMQHLLLLMKLNFLKNPIMIENYTHKKIVLFYRVKNNSIFPNREIL